MSQTVCFDPAGAPDRPTRDGLHRQPGPGWRPSALPRVLGRSRERTPEHYYVGRRKSQPRVYVVDRLDVRALAQLRYRSDAEFDWGGPSEGAFELAFAVLNHAAGDAPPEQVCRVFCDKVIAELPADGFVLPHGQIALWLVRVAAEVRRVRPAYRPVFRRRWVGWTHRHSKGA